MHKMLLLGWLAVAGTWLQAEVLRYPLEVLVVAGQSNACGPNQLPAADAVDTSILYYYKLLRGSVVSQDPNDEGNWMKPNGLTNLRARTNKYGSEIQLARSFLANNPGKKLMVVKVCAGSSSIFKHWMKSDISLLGRHLLPTITGGLALARSRGYEPVIRGFVWIQGESDVYELDIHNHPLRTFYAGGLNALISSLRQSLGVTFPVLVARTRGVSSTPVTDPRLAELRREQRFLSSCNTWARTVSIDSDVEGRFDGTIHWNAEAHRRIGSRLAFHQKSLSARGSIAMPACNSALVAEWLDYSSNHR